MKSAKNIKGLQSIGEIIPAALKKIDGGRNMSKYTVIINWEKIVGKEIADNSFVSNVDRSTLIIKVKNSVWSHHLLMFKEEIIKKTNCYLGKNLITDIWFMAGYDRNNQNYKNNETVPEENLITPLRLNEAEVAAAGMIAGEISDDRIRNKVVRLLIKDKSIKKAKTANNWQKCLSCEVLVPPEKKYCTVCQINRNKRNAERNKTNTIEKLLREAPWLNYDEMKNYIDASPEEYDTAKKNLVRYYVKEIFAGSGGKIFQADLVMLLKEIKPEKLNQVCIDSVIGEIEKRLLKKGGEKKYVSASGN